ncbi:MAG: DNA-binding transcriptional ArsR family regulator [Candidatus Omnitrophota bacterium]|jgi:DNA-binding transcriptional ArsR family regulator
MKTVKRASQLLKGFADQTRLRIVNLLASDELNVNELCTIMGKEQSLMSKHLAQLKLLDVVSDRKDGLKAYYYLLKVKDKEYNRLLGAVTEGFSNLKLIKDDMIKLKRLKKT